MSELRHILYVDDEADIREIVATSIGLDPTLLVQTCSSGTEALKYIQKSRPDLIIMDVMMPDMDGPLLLKTLRMASKTASIPVIFLTAKVQPSERDRFTALGILGVVQKPFNPMNLVNEIKRLWETMLE